MSVMVRVQWSLLRIYFSDFFVGPKVEDISLDDPDSTSMNDLKILIHEKFGVPVEAQKVIFKGQFVVYKAALLHVPPSVRCG